MADMVSRIYTGFRGVDFRGDEINLARSPDSLNMWRDYKKTEGIRTRPGMKQIKAFDAPVYGIYFYYDQMLVHSGTKLYRYINGEKTVLADGVNNQHSNGFVFSDGEYNVFYFMDGKSYIEYDGNISDVEGYIPETSIHRSPAGGGEPFQDVNMLTGLRKNSFVGDGKSTKYYLDAQELDDFVPEVTIDGEDNISFQWDAKLGMLEFSTAPLKPATEGQDNVTITFKKTRAGNREAICGCTLMQVFDNRVFVSGNPDYPNRVWHCSLEDPTYFSDTDYYDEGADRAEIRGMVAGNNALWVFREPSDANTTVFYHTPTLDEEDGKIYPSVHSSVTTGCIGRAINFNDDIVFFSDRGMEGISGDITTEQVVEHRSSLVDRKMIADESYKNMILEEWEGYLFVFIGNKAYLADSRSAFTNEDHIEYEWFYWQMEKDILCAKVHDGILHLGTEDGVYTLTDNEKNIESYWVTPKDKFKNPHKLKTTNKRGCVAEATTGCAPDWQGEITVYAKAEDTEYVPIGEYTNVSDYFVSRIKQKKFKDIQLKFHSNTRFSLESITLEVFIGGYIKR